MRCCSSVRRRPTAWRARLRPVAGSSRSQDQSLFAAAAAAGGALPAGVTTELFEKHVEEMRRKKLQAQEAERNREEGEEQGDADQDHDAQFDQRDAAIPRIAKST